MDSTADEHVLSVRLANELYERLRRYAFEQRVAQAEVIRKALLIYFEMDEGQVAG